MLRLLVFFGLLVLYTRGESHSKHAQGKIVGGFDTTIEDHPYQVSLRKRGSHWCGGSLVAPNVVLTAAHCLEVWELPIFTVTAGNTAYNSGNNLQRPVAICRHPKYNAATSDYDVALLKLRKPYNLTSTIQLVPLVESGTPELEEGEIGIVTGWGTTKQGEHLPPKVLQEADIPYIPRSECNADYQDATIPADITDRMICFGYVSGGIDSCQGDSGGPMYHDKKQVGVVSWGYGCGDENYPGVYTNIANPEINSYITQCMKNFQSPFLSKIK